jgi:hypothetical protein
VSDRAVCRNHRLSRPGALLLGDEQVLIQAGMGESPELRGTQGRSATGAAAAGGGDQQASAEGLLVDLYVEVPLYDRSAPPQGRPRESSLAGRKYGGHL